MGIWAIFTFGANMNTVVINIPDKGFGEHRHTFLFDTHLGGKLLAVRMSMSSAFVRTAKEFSKVVEPS